MHKPSAINIIRACSTAIMILAAVVSYGHQYKLLLGWGVDTSASAITPITVDLLAIICTLAIHTEGIAREGRRAAIIVLLVAGAASSSANFIAGGSLGSKIANVWSVVAYLLAEWVAAKVKAAPAVATVDLRRSEAARKAHVTRKANKALATTTRPRKVRVPATGDEAVAQIKRSGVAPVSPAPVR